MITIDTSLHYLRESLVNYENHDMMKQIAEKLAKNDYQHEEEFVQDLDQEEIAYLDSVVEKELNYARNAGDDVRAKQLKDVYELLF
ncbi:sporulation protein [Lentibacillus salinarum]|uniref:Sporulation protein n=1 Tax=Lentibacillus salinarum TaxID=446820 RepID=A0ABW3ZUP9_9BACI